MLRTVRAAGEPARRTLCSLWPRALPRSAGAAWFSVDDRRAASASSRTGTCCPASHLSSLRRTLSERINAGAPRVINKSASTSITSAEPSLRATRIDRHSRVNSSTTFSSRNLRPSRVRSSIKSYAQTWFARSGRSRTHDPSFSHSRPRLGCRAGTFSPSRRQMRSTRLWLQAQPSARNRAVIRR